MKKKPRKKLAEPEFNPLHDKHVIMFCLMVAFMGMSVFASGTVIAILFLLVVIYAAVIAAGHERNVSRPVLLMGIPLLLIVAGVTLFPNLEIWKRLAHSGIQLTIHLSGILLMSYCAFVILSSLVSSREVGPHEILGVVSLYLFIGVIWAEVYMLVYEFVPGSFLMPSTQDPFLMPSTQDPFLAGHSLMEQARSQLRYFSFVTMSTLGYGDITPQNSLAQFLVIIQTIAGQFYLATVVAYMVSQYLRQPKK